MWMSEHQRPWTLGAIVAMDLLALKESLADRLAVGRYQRCWLVVGGDHGYWREERLCLRDDGTWVFVLDSHRAKPTAPRIPPHPERIAELENRARALILRDGLVEGVIHTARSPGLLLIGYDGDVDTLYGLSGYRDLLEVFWEIRVAGRLARGTDPQVGKR